MERKPELMLQANAFSLELRESIKLADFKLEGGNRENKGNLGDGCRPRVSDMSHINATWW